MFKHKRPLVENTQLMDDVYGSGLKPQGDPLLPERVSPRNSTLQSPVTRQPRHANGRAQAALETTAHLAGRAIFGGFFLYNALNHFQSRKALAEYARSKQVPVADAAVIGTGLMMAVGGLSLITGARPKVGAASVAGFLLGASPVMHAYWTETDPQRRQQELINFTKNMALIGGALLAAGHPEPWWPWRARIARTAA